VTKLPGDDRHWHGAHRQDRRVGVAPDVETDRRHDAGMAARLAHRTQLFRPFPPPIVAPEDRLFFRAPGGEDGELASLLAAALDEAKRRGTLPSGLAASALDDPTPRGSRSESRMREICEEE